MLVSSQIGRTRKQTSELGTDYLTISGAGAIGLQARLTIEPERRAEILSPVSRTRSPTPINIQ